MTGRCILKCDISESLLPIVVSRAFLFAKIFNTLVIKYWDLCITSLIYKKRRVSDNLTCCQNYQKPCEQDIALIRFEFLS